MVTCDNPLSSETHCLHLAIKSSVRISSQPIPADQISCIKTFALMVKGARNCYGSNSCYLAEDISLRKLHAHFWYLNREGETSLLHESQGFVIDLLLRHRSEQLDHWKIISLA